MPVSSNPLRRLGFAVVLLGLAGWSAVASAEPARNVILVHGAWADGSSWSRVIPLLAARGLNVTAVQLPLTSLADDAAAVRRAIALETGPVVLVGHSYGGAVITEAGNDPKVTALVYVAAFAPDAGQSAVSMTSSLPPSPIGAEIRPDPEGFLKLTRAGVFDDLAADLPAGERTVIFAAQAPTSVRSMGGTISTPAWRSRPSWYIVAAHDRVIPPSLEASMARTIQATTTTVPSGHLMMLSRPEAVATVIENAAAP